MKPLKLIATILLRTTLVSLALILFFSLMAGMYYKSSPTKIRTAIVDEDQSPLSRSIIYNLQQSQYIDVCKQSNDYLNLQKLIDQGVVDVGIVIPHNAYHNVLNKQNVTILAVLNGTANPIIPKMSLMMINKIIMTLNIQMSMHVRVEELGGMPNTRHAKQPLLSVHERVFYDPSLSMESSMLPAFMGLAMQIVSMLIVLFALLSNLKLMKTKMSFIKLPRQMPIKAILPPFVISWLIVATAINVAFFTTMHLFHIDVDNTTLWNTVWIISLFVLSMESLSFLLVLNIKSSALIAGIITLIVFPAFMYSGYLIPINQMADLPNMIGNAFPLRHYLQALYPIFNHHQPLTLVYHQLNSLWLFVAAFFGTSVLTIIIGQLERKYRMKKFIKEETQHKIEEK